MKTKKPRPEEQRLYNYGDKDTKIPITMQILELLKSGKEFSAFEINLTIMQNDARKRISDLRRDGFPIVDRQFSGKRKYYKLAVNWEQIMIDAKKYKPLDLFNDGIN